MSTRSQQQLSEKDLRIIGHVIERLEDALGMVRPSVGEHDDYTIAILTECVDHLELLMKEDRREEDDPNQYNLPLAGGFMFPDDEEELNFNREAISRNQEDDCSASPVTQQSRCF